VPEHIVARLDPGTDRRAAHGIKRGLAMNSRRHTASASCPAAEIATGR
jgi:hypothetical protein